MYIAANLTSSQLEGEGEGEGEGFVLGDGKEYGGFANHMLKDGKDYNVGLWFSVPGTSTPVVAVYAMTVATATDGTYIRTYALHMFAYMYSSVLR